MRMYPVRDPKADIKTMYVGPTDYRTAFCGHKIDIHRPPHSNCLQCWTFFFINNVEFTQSMAALLLKEGGEKAIKEVHGDKLAKRLKWFFTSVAKMKEVEDIIKRREAEEALADAEYDIVVPGDGSGIARIEQPAAAQKEEEADGEIESN